MPLIEIKHVISFTSEDSKHAAENLLKPEMYYKWRCSSGGEKQAIVILQLEKASQIHQVDIGNNGSAFIEVLVGRSSWDPKEEYQVLIVASSFMSPADSKSNTNPNRVRMFGSENLNRTVAEQKWDRVKIVCTQPYNKEEPYGLSFVTFHAPLEEESNSKEKPTTEDRKKLRIGGFALRDESSSPAMSIGNMFKKRTHSVPSLASSTMSLAASARDASYSLVGASTKKSPSLSSPISHNLVKKLSPASTSVTKWKSDMVLDKTGCIESSKRKAESSTSKEVGKNKHNEVIKTVVAPPAKKVKTSEMQRVKKPQPFNKLMAKVVFVLSGFMNPERGDLRENALAMGAQYRPDWTPDSTHLICAFKNTPKFIQVKGKGKIVSKKWIIDCKRKRERLPIQSYRMDGGGDSTPESEEEEVKKSTTNKISEVRLKSDQEMATASTAEEEKTNVIDDPYGGDTDIEDDIPNLDEHPGPSQPRKLSSSECDTEDELRKIRELQEADDPYGGSTEEDNIGESDNELKMLKIPTPSELLESKMLNRTQSELPSLPDFFDAKHFFFYGDFVDKTRRLLNRYITAYGGTVSEYMADEVQFVITDDDWDKNFDQALEENASLVFIHSKWIFKCHEKSGWVPYQSYVIVPT